MFFSVARHTYVSLIVAQKSPFLGHMSILRINSWLSMTKLGLVPKANLIDLHGNNTRF